VDSGANIGLYAIALARRVGTGGRVHAFEPEPANFRTLDRHCRLNGSPGKSFFVRHCRAKKTVVFRSRRGVVANRESVAAQPTSKSIAFVWIPSLPADDWIS
jgi:FkbM family methyltransferase